MIAGDDTAEVLMSRRQISKGHSGTEMLVASYSNVQPSNSANNDPSEGVSVLVSSWFARPASQWSTEDDLLWRCIEDRNLHSQ
ncbi:MAG: hypothetical protein B7Y96_08100 [Comamonadaceae bacterium 32-67-11]|nr:MAG: hypothetical protein B7Y96_08100 [Comamonadaceae bacterium 32-67-11]